MLSYGKFPNYDSKYLYWLWSILRAAHFVQRLFLHLSPLSSPFSPCLCDVRGYRGQMCQGSIKGWCLHLGSNSSHHSRIQGWSVQASNSLAVSVSFICNSPLPGRQPSTQLHLGWFSSKSSCSGFFRDLKIKFAAISDVKEVEALDWVGWCCWMVGVVFCFKWRVS